MGKKRILTNISDAFNDDEIQNKMDKEHEISSELCDFVSVPVGTRMSRRTVAEFVCDYLRKNKISDGKSPLIVPDDALRKLLGEPKEDVTYFNLNKLLDRHFT